MSKKRIFAALLGLITLYLGYLLYIFVLSPKTNLQPMYLIPKDAVFVLESDRPVEAWKKVSESGAWSHLNTNAYFSALTENIQQIDTIFKNQQRLFERFDGRSLLISIHMTSPKEYGIFYVLDLKRIAKLKLVKTYLSTLLNENHTLSERSYHDHTIYEVFDRTTKETAHLAFVKNQLIASYTHTLVEAAIDQYEKPAIGRDLNFININKKVGYEDQFRVYVQYPYIDDYVNYFTNETGGWVKSVSENFQFSGFHMDLEDDFLFANGYTNLSPNTPSFLKPLLQSGKAKRTVAEIAPRSTGVYLSYGFGDFGEFYANVETMQHDDPERFKAYQEGIRTTEKILKISVEEHFFSWIGNEIALLQLAPKIQGQQNDVALAIKTKDVANAKENLDHVIKQIRKRTPVKFKAIDYMGHQINFLSIKGFFKLLFGARFEEFDKPYFTVIRDFVVFSNNPNTLKSMINDFEVGNTLVNAKEFQVFDGHFDEESSLYLYANVPLAFDNLYRMMDAQTKTKMQKNKDFIICFPQLGFHLTPEKDLFKSRFITKYENAQTVRSTPFYTQKRPKPKSQPISSIPQKPTEAVFELPQIYPPDLNAKAYVKKYRSGLVRFQVDLRDGIPHGRYQAFYADGTQKMTGRFKDGEQTGTWRYYDRKGALVLKKRF